MAPKDSGIADTQACSPSPRAGCGEEGKGLIDALDDHFRHHVQRAWPTAWPKPLPNACTTARTDLWGYAAGEQLSNDDMIAEKYRGIRPAPGYPCLPGPQRQDRPVPRAERRRNRHGA